MEVINDKHEIYRPYNASCTFCKHDFTIVGTGENKHLEPLKSQQNSVVFERA
jgi:hypothetical protein